MINIEPEKVIKEILLHELGLPANYGKDSKGFIIPSVYVYQPNINLSNTDKLQICIQSIGSQILANDNFSRDVSGVFTEFQETVAKESIQIDVFSRDESARLRRFEVVTALHSIFAQQKQEEYAMRIFNIPSRINQTNEVEGEAKIYRYSLTIDIMHKKEYQKTVDYYNKFRINSSIDTLDNTNKTIIPN